MNVISHHVDGWLVSLTVHREPYVRWVAVAVKLNRSEQAVAGTQYDALRMIGDRAGINHEKLLQSFGVES